MNIAQVKELIIATYPMNLPVCLLSQPGSGKSSIIQQAVSFLADIYKTPFGMIEIRGASSSPSELAAIKYVHAGSVLEAEQAWVPTAERVAAGECPERGIIFCDELPSSLPSVISTLQRLFLDRKLGGLTLAPGWYVVAAGNRASDKSASNNLSLAFVNRCLLVTVDNDPDVTFNWGIDNDIDHRVLAYLRFRPTCLQDFDPSRRSANPAFCSPRSLENLSKLIKPNLLSGVVLSEAITGLVGDAVGSEFNGFLQISSELPDIDDILKNPADSPIPKAVNVLYATIGALNSRAKDDKSVGQIMKYFTRLGTEMAVVAIKDLGKINTKAYTTPEFISWASDNVRFAV